MVAERPFQPEPTEEENQAACGGLGACCVRSQGNTDPEQVNLLAQSEALKPEDDELEAHGVKYEDKYAFMQVTIRTPLDYSPLNLIALAYGFLPFIVPALFVLDLLYTLARSVKLHLFSTWALVIMIFCFILNEFILKPILKQPRPFKTANKHKDGSIKPGMPSGHVYNASALMVWLLCEAIMSGANAAPIASILVVLLLMGPVPWARVYNYDHTVAQCAVSSVLGLITGIVAYVVRSQIVYGNCEPWAEEPPWFDCFESDIAWEFTNFTAFNTSDISGNVTLGAGVASGNESSISSGEPAWMGLFV